jgi:hypothetical protein
MPQEIGIFFRHAFSPLFALGSSLLVSHPEASLRRSVGGDRRFRSLLLGFSALNA